MDSIESASIEYTFRKSERLCGHTFFDLLFRDGQSFTSSPFRITWMLIPKKATTVSPVRAAFVVPKRNFKKASQRNRIRRRMKEAYRLNKKPFISSFPAEGHDLIFTCVYTAREETEYVEILKKIIVTLQRLEREIKEPADR